MAKDSPISLARPPLRKIQDSIRNGLHLELSSSSHSSVATEEGMTPSRSGGSSVVTFASSVPTASDDPLPISPVKMSGRPASTTSTSAASTSALSSSISQVEGPTPSSLASALGISSTSCNIFPTHKTSMGAAAIPRKGPRGTSKQGNRANSIPPPAWARRPSLPTMPSMGNRMSVASVSSFDSLPEGETVPHFATSPLAKSLSARRGSVEEEEEAGPSGSSEGGSSAVSAAPPTSMPLSRTGHSTPAEDMKKRKHLAMELLSTEHVYLSSLRLINDNYYQPLAALSRGVPVSRVECLSSAAPALSRKAMSEIFANFIDILHLNQELLARLDDRLTGRTRETPSSRPHSLATSAPDSPQAAEEEPTRPWDAEADCIGDLLVPMAPFLKMYSLFVKNFSSALSRIESERKTNDSFARFLRETEKATWGRASVQGGFGFGLGFQAHLLTIIQRIPRYKLLVGDLVRCTPSTHRDYADLRKAYGVIEQVAESINDNIRQHEMVVVMLGLQRSLVGLPEPLIVPGRSLMKRGTLLKACRKNIQAREFFLFNDCLIYAAPTSGSIDAASAAWQVLSRYGTPDILTSSPLTSPRSPTFAEHGPPSFEHVRVRTRTMSGPSLYDGRRSSASLEGQQLQFRGKFNLQDCTVVAVDDIVAPEPWLRHCLEIRTPGKSFAIYADTLAVKLQWLSAIRNAREEWVSNRRTLHAEEDSIQAKRDRRRSLQVGASARVTAVGRKTSLALEGSPPATVPESEVAATVGHLERLPRSSSSSSLSLSLSLSRAENNGVGLPGSLSKPRSLKVLEEYNAPVWVPDSRADRCACCNESFGIWRRKHHCRLCGQVVCWACSSKTFLIASYEEGEEDRPARACDVCYESVFPESPQPTPSLLVSSGSSSSGSGSNKEAAQRRPSTGRPESEVSVDAPTTPTSPSFIGEASNYSDIIESTAVANVNGGHESIPSIEIALSRRAMGQKNGRLPKKARGIDALLMYQNSALLSPQVQAATSGSGTFRLVTPRLTTPEGEPSSAMSTSGGDYFAGVEPGQSELKSARQPVVPRLQRKKPLSAAARLSSVYGGLSSPSVTNLSSSHSSKP